MSIRCVSTNHTKIKINNEKEQLLGTVKALYNRHHWNLCNCPVHESALPLHALLWEQVFLIN